MIKFAIGIDPGRSGAFAAIDCTTGEARVYDMPDHGDERGIDVAAVDLILEKIGSVQSVVGLEWNSGRPGEVPDFAYRFGLQTGQIDALLFARGYNVTHLASSRWTMKLGLPGKTHNGALPQRSAFWDTLYPSYASLIRGPRGGLLDGRLDALCIAEYMRRGHATLLGHRGGRRPPIHRGVGGNPLAAWTRPTGNAHNECGHGYSGDNG